MKTINLENRVKDNQESNKDILLTLSKFFYALFLLYYGWFQMVFFSISNMSLLLGAGMILFIMFHSLRYKTPILQSLTFEIVIWALFAITSLATGLIVAVNIGLLISSIMNFVEYLIMIFGMVYISSKDKKISFFINIYIVFSLACAMTTVISGVNYTSSRITMSVSTNPNTLGISMVIGIFCVLYKIDFKKILVTLFLLCELFLFFYVIILTGSRKSLLSAVILLVLWFIFVRKNIFRYTTKPGIGKQFLLLIFLFFGVYLLFLYTTDSYIMLRLEKLFDTGDDTRISMYIAAIELFMESPFVGVGLNNYRALTVFNTYSHSTYAEVLSGTGIIGTLLYFIPYFSQIKKIIALIKCIDIYISTITKLFGALLVMLIFLGTGVIHFYDVNTFISFGFIIAFCSLHYNQTNYKGVEKRNDQL